jgi:hypothetical protein
LWGARKTGADFFDDLADSTHEAGDLEPIPAMLASMDLRIEVV